jgi:dTDP-4-dehydrorhamnose 3,5-epimerase
MKTINHSLFAFNQTAQTLRGMHYQTNGYEETKIVICALGSIFDVVIDLRPTSKTYLQMYFGKFGPQQDNIGLLVPPGCAHGYLTLADDTAVVYFLDQPHSTQNERGIAWNDPKFKIPWPSEPKVISKRDRNHPNFI